MINPDHVGMDAYSMDAFPWESPRTKFYARPGIHPDEQRTAWLLYQSTKLLLMGVPHPHYANYPRECWEVNEHGDVCLVVGGDE